MPRTYRQSARASAQERTRRRILDAGRTSIGAGEFGVREIADRASVTVQTVYAHFGSKAGLIAAIVQDASARDGLVDGLARVWKQESPRAALDEMVKVTFEFWRRAWPLIGFTLTAVRADPDFAALVRGVDDSRLADLVTICEKLASAGELRAGMAPKTAAALVFALTSPYVYEDLVVKGRLPFATALRLVTESARAAAVATRG